MLGYRSIGEEELNMLLLARNPVYGKRCWTSSIWTKVATPVGYGVVCFFKEPYKWRDKNHLFDIIVELKNPIHGKGVYLASKDFGKNKIWTGREGKTEYEIDELYIRSYSLEDIKSINCNGFYNNSHSEYLNSVCKAYNINFTR